MKINAVIEVTKRDFEKSKSLADLMNKLNEQLKENKISIDIIQAVEYNEEKEEKWLRRYD